MRLYEIDLAGRDTSQVGMQVIPAAVLGHLPLKPACLILDHVHISLQAALVQQIVYEPLECFFESGYRHCQTKHFYVAEWLNLLGFAN